MLCLEFKRVIHFINVWVEDTVNEADAGTFVWVLIRQLDVNFPKSTLEWC